ncbi:hypothetical protein MRB53_021262 [Persea americana]|uniref:Uncharacterized protein n=1 Tax=Persea americana TaxID=3435 RepID=A0ACC2L3P6_PERAE|nr:hypothetical protein MRB53_021262 [Persea americana]
MAEGEDLLIVVRSSSHTHLRSHKTAPSHVALLHVTLSLLLFFLCIKVRFFLDDLMSTLASNKRTLEAMNSDDMLCVVHTKVEHFNKAFENDFVEFGYGKVSPSESLRQGKITERHQIVLKKKLEFATKSPKSKENTPLESTKNISIKSLSPMASPLRVKNVPSKYEGFNTSLSWPKNFAYKLTKEEIDLLDKFWEDYYERFDYLAKVCISPNPERLKRLLSREWLDTGIQQNWFDTYLKPKAPHGYFTDTNASIHWLNDSFAAYKWEERMGWRRRIVENVPLQENSHDCGFFVMASVEHVLLNLKFEFSQRDMMYYRCKLVINQYNRQLELYKKRDQQSG